MLGKIEHLGIAVKDLEASNSLYEKLLGTSAYKQEAVESENVMTSFFKAGENKIELLAATDPKVPLQNLLTNAAKAFTMSHLR